MLSVIPILVPPLRDRREDIPRLVGHFAALFCRDNNFRPKQFTPAAVDLMSRDRWRGNVRELRYSIECAELIAGGSTIHPEHLRNVIHKSQEQQSVRAPIQTLEEIEVEHIQRVLHATNGNKKLAAELLGIHRNTLTQKLQRLKRQLEITRDKKAPPEPAEESGLFGITP